MYKHKIINEISTFISQIRRYQNGDIDLIGVMLPPKETRKRLRSIIVVGRQAVKRIRNHIDQ
jgi:hypothetical protein